MIRHATLAAIGWRLALLVLAIAPFSPPAAAQGGPPGDGRTAVANRSQVRLAAGRFGAETPGRLHNIRLFSGAGSRREVIRFELRPGERRTSEESGAERAELRSLTNYRNGQTRWYSGAFRVGEFVPDSLFNIIAQWHGQDAWSPWLRFALEPNRPGRLLIQHRGRYADGRETPYETTALDISLNDWHRFVVDVRPDERDGHLRVWIDGQLRVNWAHGVLGDFRRGPDGREPRSGFWKFGIYRWGSGADRQAVRSTPTLWFTNIEQGADLTDRILHPLPLPGPGTVGD